MDKKKGKVMKIGLSVLAALIVACFGINWYLTYKLEDSLKQKLQEEVSDATSGFYKFSYDKLSVGLFSGELSIKGVELVPDSLVYQKWRSGDSLPDIYFKVHLDEIHFKGINLTWRRNYRNLNFSLFELRSPNIKVFQPLHSNLKSPLDSQPAKQPKTLYEMISAYIDVVKVERIRLKDANIYYTIEDSISPIIYSLTSANLNAYRFRLDKDSYSSGKLLYSDNFEFEANKPQQLLYSDQLILNTANIRLSTLDELVKIEGVHLHPSEDYWKDRTQKVGGYIDAEINSVTLKGIKFERENTLNYLEADSFNISSTDIKYYNVKQKASGKDSENADKGFTGWSLYTVVSPIFQEVSIGKINIEKTKFNYTLTQNGESDTYSLDHFDFHANNFLIDSLYEKQMKFWYVDNFILSASNIKGLLASNNSAVKVAKLSLDTENKHFNLSDIEVKPISTINVTKDYYIGDIKSIDITGLNYDTGISALQLNVESPNIEYFKVPDSGSDLTNSPDKNNLNISEDVLSVFNPYANYLSVKNINLSDANLALHNLETKESYKIKKLNFYALRFLIDDKTRRSQKYLFTCEDIGLSFKDFDNIISGGDYRLKIKNTNISTLTGSLLLQNIQLIPQKEKWLKAPATYYDINIPLIKIKGFDNDSYINREIARVASIVIDSPQIKITKVSNSSVNSRSKDTSYDNVLSKIKSFVIDTIDVSLANVNYIDRTLGDSSKVSLQRFELNSLLWNTHKSLKVGSLVLESPRFNTLSKSMKSGDNKETKDITPFYKLLGGNISVGKFILSNGEFKVQKPDIGSKLNLEAFAISGIDWYKNTEKPNLNVASFDIVNPVLSISKNYYDDNNSHKVAKTSQGDLYSFLNPYLNKLSINRLNLAGAHVNYEHSLNGTKQQEQALNTTNLDIIGLSVNTEDRKIDMEDVNFNTKDLQFPIMNGFYTLGVEKVDVSKKRSSLELSGIRMASVYPKMDFAYMHPTHMDWFNVTTGDIILSGVDYETYFEKNILNAKRLIVRDVMLQNMKNKKIYTPPKLQPLIYTKLNDLPFQISVDTTEVSNFSVVYEELPKNGTVSGQVSFMGMNATIDGLTNIASYPQQFMHLDANGLLMGTGYFTAKWDMPVSADYDCFVLEGHVHRFDLSDLNQIITPLAKAEVKTGILNDLTFRTEASSMNASVGLEFLYNDLGINVLKGEDKEATNKFATRIANALIRSDNPNKPGGRPRQTNIYIDRDPYHSTFNYFLQILQPALIESVGVSQKKQNFAKKISGFFTKVKNFFSKEKGEDKKVQKED